MNKQYYENGDITTVIDYRFVGYDLNAKPVYQKIITTFSISNGVIKDSEPQSVKCFYR